ncbi:TniQ family protein [Neiella marina]|uniref:TniQ family protein n=1 Tax=Neiella marina TaxID=508461 RepID=UPI000B3D3D72|nr:TniQ family protein [Neiella marina]
MRNFVMNIYPTVVRGESVRGYVERLNAVNGYKGPQDIANKLGTSYRPSLYPTAKIWKKFVKELAPYAHQPADQLWATLSSHWTFEAWPNSVLSALHLFHKGCRICPDCVAKNGYYSANWDHSLVTVCPIHRVTLIERCQECNAPLKWNRKWLGRCTECRSPLVQTNACLSSEDPLLVATHAICEGNISYTSMLLLACMRLARPFDNLLAEPFLELWDAPTIQNLLRQAIALFHSERYRAGYLDSLEANRHHQYRHLSADAVFEPWLAFKAHAADMGHRLDNVWPELNFSLDALDKQPTTTTNIAMAAHQVSSVSRSRIVSSAELAHQVSAARLSAWLSLNMEAIDDMLRHGVLKPCTSAKSFRDSLYDASIIIERLKQVESVVVQKSEALLDAGDIQCVLPLFAANFAHVVECIFEQRLRVYKTNEDQTLRQSFVDRAELFSALTTNLYTREQAIDVNTLCAILCCHTTHIKRLEQENLLTINHWHHPKSFGLSDVDLPNCRHFLNQWISLNRLCALLDIELNLLIDCIRPSCVKASHFRGISLYLLENTPDNRELLRDAMVAIKADVRLLEQSNIIPQPYKRESIEEQLIATATDVSGSSSEAIDWYNNHVIPRIGTTPAGAIYQYGSPALPIVERDLFSELSLDDRR